MKSKVLITGLIVLCFLFSGCFELIEPPASEMPKDFEFSYGTGAMHAEWGQFNLKVDGSGHAMFEKSFGLAIKKSYDFSLSELERIHVYNAVTRNGFFSLNKNYADQSIIDGGWSQITVTAENETKTVRVVNTEQDSFSKIEGKISKIILSKIGQGAFDSDDLEEECALKEQECNAVKSIECEDWAYYCGWKNK